jgi:ribosomal protein S18 acetylase RimI-like enzyme
MSFMDIVYRLAMIQDWEELRAFRNKYSNAPDNLDQKHFQQDFEEGENRNRGPLFVASMDKKIVGYGRCGYFDPLDEKPIYGLLKDLPKGYYLKGVITDESVRGLGVGKQLTVLRNEWVKERSDRIYCILQNTNIPSLKMHESLGYRTIKQGLSYQGVVGDTSGLLLELLF